jgi:two-component system sensor histidine kinase EvgS
MIIGQKNLFTKAMVTLLFCFHGLLLTHFVTAAEAQPLGQIELTEEERAWLSNHPNIQLGSATGYPPLVIKQGDSTYAGVIIDIFQLINERLNSNISLVIGDDWVDIQEKANNKVLSGLALGGAIKARAKYLTSTDPIFDTHYYVFSRSKQALELDGLEDLAGLRVGYKKGHFPVVSMLSAYPSIIKVAYDDDVSMSKGLLSSEVDAVIGWISFDYWVKNSLQGIIQPVLLIDQQPIKSTTHVRKDWPELVSILNKAIASLRQDGLQKILDKWFIRGPEKTINFKTSLSTDEKKWLKQHPVIRYSFDPSWAPIEYENENGEHSGMSAAYLAHAAEILGIEFKYEPGLSWSQSIHQLNSRTIDLLPAIQITDGRQETMNFTPAYLSTPISIFSGGDTPYIGELEALHGKKVAVVNRYATHEWLARDHPSIKLRIVPSIEDGLNLVHQGAVAAFVGNLVITSYYIRKNSLLDIRVAGDTYYRGELSMGVRKDWPELASILEKVIEAIPEHEKIHIFQNWASIRYEHNTNSSLIIKIFISVSIFFVIFILWNIRLKLEIEKIKQVEEHLLIAKQAAEKANQAKSHFLSSMSHELRTPLNSILGFSQLIQMEAQDGDTLESAEEIVAAGKHLLALINQVLDLSKIESGTISLIMKRYNLKEIVTESVSLIQPLADKKSVLLKVNVDSALSIYVDRTRFKQVLVNLISNAIKYNYPDGEVRINVEKRLANTLRISIADSGRGITDQQKKYLFNPFYRAGAENSAVEGTGLGLAISKNLIELMNGSIGLESEAENGSCFWIELGSEAEGDFY